MQALRSKIIVAESCTQTRVKICTWLAQEGYSVFECKDAFKALRLARQLLPALILLDVNLSGMSVQQLINIIETDRLSHVVLMSEVNNSDARRLLLTTSLKCLIHKPIEQGHLLDTLKNALSKLQATKILKPQKERLRLDQEKAHIIRSAKVILMNKWHLTEDQAFAYIRKTSMDNCISLYATSKSIIERHPK